MILVVDDDTVVLKMMTAVLEQDGRRVVACASGSEALATAAREEPELVICDVMMPEVDGHEVARRYRSEFPDRDTPFVFLSSLTEPEEVVRGLELGADDYLTKPVVPAVLKAKVRSYLRRAERRPVRVYGGELGDIPFPRLVRLCEESGLTGWLEVDAGYLQTRIQFRGGRLDESSASDEDFEQLFTLTAARFQVTSEPARLEGLAEVAAQSSEPAAPVEPTAGTTAPALPSGMLSGIKIGERLLQVQTEVTSGRPQRIVTVVILDGRTLVNRESELEQTERSLVEQAIARQHHGVEQEIRDKLEVVLQKDSSAEHQELRSQDLYDLGVEKYLMGELEAAVTLWDQAAALDPDNETLLGNIKLGREKLAAAARVDASGFLHLGDVESASKAIEMAASLELSDEAMENLRRRLKRVQETSRLERIQRLMVDANRAVEDGELRRATFMLLEATGIDPGNRPVAQLLKEVRIREAETIIRSHLQAGELEQALHSLEVAQKIYPGEPRVQTLRDEVRAAREGSGEVIRGQDGGAGV